MLHFQKISKMRQARRSYLRSKYQTRRVLSQHFFGHFSSSNRKTSKQFITRTWTCSIHLISDAPTKTFFLISCSFLLSHLNAYISYCTLQVWFYSSNNCDTHGRYVDWYRLPKYVVRTCVWPITLKPPPATLIWMLRIKRLRKNGASKKLMIELNPIQHLTHWIFYNACTKTVVPHMYTTNESRNFCLSPEHFNVLNFKEQFSKKFSFWPWTL